MARYTGPKWKISRRENADIFDNDKWRRRSTLPGVHPVSKGRPTGYAVQLREKQKVKRMYGLLERQFRIVFKHASKATGNTGLRLLQLLELRLDNVVYKMGLARSRNQARQYVTHGHVLVNGNKLDIPAHTVSVGDTIELKIKIVTGEVAKILKSENKNKEMPAWLQGNKVAAEPTRDMLDPSIKEQLIVEFYSR